jgi:type IV secretory pathway VirB9-like protein
MTHNGFRTRLAGIVPAFLVAAAAIVGTAAFAQEITYRNGYAEIMYQDDDIYTLGMRVKYKTVFFFPDGEVIKRVEPGIKGSSLEVKFGQNWVTIRPNQEKLDTNLQVMTEQTLPNGDKVGRGYTFVLKEGIEKLHQRVMILRPDMDPDPEVPDAPPIAGVSQPVLQAQPPATAPQPKPVAQAQSSSPVTVNGHQVTVDDLGDGRGGTSAPAVASGPVPRMVAIPGVPGADLVRNLDGGYTIKNQKPRVFEVDKVYNDGERTFVIFKSLLKEAPLFYRITADGKREVVTYRIEPARDKRDKDIFIIPRLIDVGVVKMGDFESKFVWKKVKD